MLLVLNYSRRSITCCCGAGSAAQPVRGDQEVHRGPHHQDLLQPGADGEGENLPGQTQHYPRQIVISAVQCDI